MSHEVVRWKPEVIREAAFALLSGFVWQSTKEGHAYWSDIHAKLTDMAQLVERAKERIGAKQP